MAHRQSVYYHQFMFGKDGFLSPLPSPLPSPDPVGVEQDQLQQQTRSRSAAELDGTPIYKAYTPPPEPVAGQHSRSHSRETLPAVLQVGPGSRPVSRTPSMPALRPASRPPSGAARVSPPLDNNYSPPDSARPPRSRNGHAPSPTASSAATFSSNTAATTTPPTIGGRDASTPSPEHRLRVAAEPLSSNPTGVALPSPAQAEHGTSRHVKKASSASSFHFGLQSPLPPPYPTAPYPENDVEEPKKEAQVPRTPRASPKLTPSPSPPSSSRRSDNRKSVFALAPYPTTPIDAPPPVPPEGPWNASGARDQPPVPPLRRYGLTTLPPRQPPAPSASPLPYGETGRVQRTPPSEPNNDIDTEQEVDLPPPPPPPPANEKPLRPRSLIRPRSLHGPLTVTGADAQPATAVPVPALPDPTAFPLGGNASNTAATEDPLDMIDRSPLPVDDHRRRYYDTEITHIYHQELQKDLFPRSQPPPPSPPPITEHPTPARPFPLAFSLYQSPNILTNHHTGIYMLGVSRRRPLYAVSVHDPADQRGHNDAHHHHASKRKSRLMRGGAGSSNGSGFPLEHAHSHANSHGHEPSLVLYNGADLDYDDRLGGSGSTVSPWAAVHLGSGTWGEDMGIELPVLDPEERKRLVDVDFDDDVDRGPLDTGKRSVVEPVRGWLLPDARSLRFVFSVEVTVTTGSHRPKLHGDTGVRLVREQFEWRHTRGEEAIARLTAGTGGGGKRTNAPENWAWKLVRLGPKGRDKSPLHSHDAKPTGPAAIPAVNAAELDTDDVDILHPVMPPVSSSSLSLRTADNHDVVLLLLTSYPRSLTKRAKFLFVGPGATGELGPRFAVAAVATGLGLWERGRRGGGSGGGGGGGIGIVNGGSPTGVGAGTAAGSNGGGWNASATPPSVSVAF